MNADQEERIEKAKHIAKVLEEALTPLPTGLHVLSVHADDWDMDCRKFHLIAYLRLNSNGFPVNKTFSMRRITDVIRKYLKEHSFEIFPPERKYYSSYGQKSFDGYERDYISINLWV